MSNFGRQIEAFRAVMMMGGMTTAAETLLITQPAVSRLIRDLEFDLKIQLFHRKGNQITPTAEATSFLAEIERSYLGLDQLRAYASDLRRSVTGSLHISALPALAFGFLPFCLSAFAADRPKLSILLDGVPSHMVIERVIGGHFEIGFAEVPTDRPMLNQTPLKANAMVVMPTGHPLAKFDRLSAEQLVNEQIIMLGRGSYTRHTIERALGSLPRQPNLIETPLAGIACGLVARGMGVTIVDPFTAMTFRDQGLVARPLTPDLDVGFFMLTARSRPMSKLAAEFAGAIQQYADEFLAPLFDCTQS
ncbi:MAG: LysR family transcriptional regulator [Rhizobium sp.]|nr:LysR family transcriptional regulator [Rhizobium sp.]